jgi:group I intron endonuclease
MVMPIHYIYKIINRSNGKIYVGKSKNPASRFVRHIKIAETLLESDNHFQAIHGAIKKYGRENFTLEIIEACDDSNVDRHEIYWISKLHTQEKTYGYNLTSGGDGVHNRSEESKKKWLAKMVGRKLSEEHKRKISAGNVGRKLTEDAKQKISEANSGTKNGMGGRTHNVETRTIMSEFQSLRPRRPLTDQEKQHLSDNLKGKPKPAAIPIEIKNEITRLYSSGNYTKRQLAEKFELKYNSIVKIIRTNKTT